MRSSAPTSRRHRGLAGVLAAALVASPLALGLTSAADASVSTKIATFPYNQTWSTADAITTNDDWSNVTGVQGYLGQELTASTGTDAQTVLGDSTVANDTDVI